MEQPSLVLEKREVVGKKVRALRRQGIIPVHLYGPGVESRSLQAPANELIKALTRVGHNRPLQVRVKRERKQQLAFVREVQRDPLRGDLLHVDLLHVELTQHMRAGVPIRLVGEAPALSEYRATVIQNAFSIEVEALPMAIPEQVEVDLSVLTDLDKEIRVRDIKLPQEVSLVSDGEALVARVEPIREEVPVVEVAAPEEAEAPVQAAEREQPEGEAGEGEKAA